MSAFLIYNARLVRPGVGVEANSYVRVEEGRIAEMGAGTPPFRNDLPAFDAEDRLLTPGLVDMHTHGIRDGYYDRGAGHLMRAAEILPTFGVTTVVPTVVPRIEAPFFDLLAELGETIPKVHGVTVPGLHLEGPFVAIAGAACDTRDGDLVLLEELLDACGGRVAIMSISPETPNVLPVIERLIERGVTPFITHTRANVEQTVAAIDAGARHATHFYDVFPAPEETDPGVRPVGVVEAILGDPRASCDFICDGIHVHPMAIRAAVAAKGWAGVALITDSSFGAGMPPGEYDTPWGYPVRIEAGGAPRIAAAGHPLEGALAGSALTMNRGVANLLRWLDLPPEQIWAMGTLTPACVLGLERKGRLEPGADADLVLWEESPDLRPARTWTMSATSTTPTVAPGSIEQG